MATTDHYYLTDKHHKLDLAVLAEVSDLYDLREYRPKLIPLKDLIHIEVKPQMWLMYAKSMVTHSHEYEGVTKENFYDFMSVADQNHWYHSIKLMWLMNEIKTHGLYSYPQAYIKDGGRWVVHPGQFRVHALICLEKWEQEFILWDEGFPDVEELSFLEWFGLFKDCGRTMFVTETPNLLEMHVGEERLELYDWTRKVHEMYKGNKITLEGRVVPEITNLFDLYEYDGVGVGIVTKNDYVLQEFDLKWILHLTPSTQKVEKENFTFYNNYHK
jgi:hypothetical protein